MCVNLHCVLQEFRVEADSVEDFLDRHCKPERFRGRGEEHVAALIASHLDNLERDGYTAIVHDSVTGEMVVFFAPDDVPQEPPPDTTVAPSSIPGSIIIHSYTRAQAIEDGVLVDVSELAHEIGFLCPVALTAGVWALVEDIPPADQVTWSVQDRLRRVLRWAVNYVQHNRDQNMLLFNVPLRHGRNLSAALKVVAGGGDQGELVLTIMFPDED
jgi:hypothetical protein